MLDTISLREYVFDIQQNVLTEALTRIAQRGVNIRAYSQQLLRNGLAYRVRLVPGDGSQRVQQLSDFSGVQTVLRELQVPFRQQEVTAVLVPDRPGQLAAIQRALQGVVRTEAVYFDFASRIIYATSSAPQTQATLAKLVT